MKKADAVAEKVFMYNYFILFGIEPDFNIDLSKLEKKYIELSRKFHPDVNSGQLGNIINVNKAYEVLKSPLKRAEHVLDLFNVKGDLSTEILHELMEMREHLLDCSDFQSANRMISEKIKDCMRDLTNAFTIKDFNCAATQVLRLKYLHKSLEEVKKNAANSNF